MDKKIQWVVAKIMEKVNPKFYGSITIKFQDGKVHCIETRQTEKPD